MTCRSLFAKCGSNVNIESRAFFYSGKRIAIGDNSSIGVNCSLYGKITIGKNVMMGPDVVTIARNHAFSQTTLPMIEQGYEEERPISIGDDVWIGTRVIILPGVSIGSGVIIGSGAVVTKDIPDWSIAAGNPARVIRYRKINEKSHAKYGE
jgi:maltose O-acetyltransferase